MLSKHARYYGLGMDALVSGCSRNTHVNYYGSGKDALVSGCSRNMNVIMVGHGCSSDRMLAKHERYYGLDMNAMLTVCSRNTNVIIVWAWMAERSRTALCCPATKHCEYGHKMVSGSLASAQNPTRVSKIELLQPPQNRAVTPGWREEPVSKLLTLSVPNPTPRAQKPTRTSWNAGSLGF